MRYSYDAVGNMIAMLEYTNPGSASGQIQWFGYDHLNRLESAYSEAEGAGQYNHSGEANDYDYDKLGNITAFGNSNAYNYTNRHAGCTGQPTYTQPQAVKQIGGNYYCYDGNGNMTKRVEGGVTYTQNFNVENELASVVTGGNTTTFTYDAAGIRVKTVRPGGKTSYYPFPTYEEEVNGSVTTQRSAYLLAGQTVGVRVKVVGGANNYYFALTDHLGSTSVLLNNNGGVVSDSTARYLPFGGWRTTPTAGLTDIGFTGHRHNNIGAGAENIGLIYMNARWYLPGIGRFASADTIVPDPQNPQSYNRYSYVRNSPLNFTDPTGHRECSEDCSTPLPPFSRPKPFTSPFINFTGSGWSLAEKQMAHQAASDIAQRMANEVNSSSAEETFSGVFGGPITLHKYTDRSCTVATGCRAWISQTTTTIYVGKSGFTNHYLMIHEIFYLLDIVVLNNAANEALWDVQRPQGSTFPNRPNLDEESDLRWGFAGGNFGEWQKSRSGASGEEFADMGIGWTYNQWDSNTKGLTRAGQARADFMNVNMAIWLTERIP